MNRELYEYLLTLYESTKAIICDEVLWLTLGDETIPDPCEELNHDEYICKLLNLVVAAVAEGGKR